MVAICAAYPAPHFTLQVASVWVFSTITSVQPSSPSPFVSTPVANVYAAHSFSATNTRERAESSGPTQAHPEGRPRRLAADGRRRGGVVTRPGAAGLAQVLSASEKRARIPQRRGGPTCQGAGQQGRPARRGSQGRQSRTDTDRLAARGGAAGRVGSARDGRRLRHVSSAALHGARGVRVSVQHDAGRAAIGVVARHNARRKRVRGAVVLCSKGAGRVCFVGPEAVVVVGAAGWRARARKIRGSGVQD